MRALGDALQSYGTSCHGFPDQLSRLGPLSEQDSTCVLFGAINDPLLVDSVLKREGAILDGYEWRYVPRDAVEAAAPPVFRHYELTATWVAKEGVRHSFWTSDAGIIRSARGRAAGSADPALE